LLFSAEIPVGEPTDEDPQLVKAYEEVSAIFDFRPDRLGHALLLPASLREKLMVEVKVPVESCPTSNVMTLELAKHKSGDLIHGLQQHPQLKYWLESKYPISIGTDDPGVFNTNATQELLLLARALGVRQQELKRIVLDSVYHGFCRGEVKDKIKRQMTEFFDTMVLS
jgi:adenosine deaminase